MQLLDTDVMIDVLRGYQPAVAWLESLPEAPGLPGFVAMELMDGCRSKLEMIRLHRRIQPFQLYWPTQEDCDRALVDFRRNHLAHNLGILDAIIGHCVVGLAASLCTFNLKHYGGVQGLITEQPYQKESPHEMP